MNEMELLKKLSEFDSDEGEEVSKWLLDVEDVLKKNNLYDVNKYDLSGLRIHGRVKEFQHFNNIKAVLNHLYRKKYEELVPPVQNLKQSIFVAMKFSKDMEQVYENVYKPVGEQLGLDVVRIDEQHFTGLIIKQIENCISNAVYMVADLTHNCSGVYYEAGIAAGLKLCNHPIQIVWTCRKEEFDKDGIHFDVQGDNVLIYRDVADLQKRLLDRLQGLLKGGGIK